MLHPDPQTLAAGFLAPRISLPGIELRPLSSASFFILKRTKNSLVTSSPSDDDAFSRLAAVIEFIYVHGAPISDVLKASELPTPRQCARDLEMQISDFLELPEPERREIAGELMLSRFRAAALAYNTQFPLDITPDAQDSIERETGNAAAAVVEPKEKQGDAPDPN